MNKINRILSEKILTSQVRRWMPILAGNLLMAIGVNGFIIPAGFIAGGSTGLAIVLERLVHIPFNMAVNLISISCFVIGFLVLGRKFAARTLVSAVAYPVCIQLTSFLKNLDVTSDPLVQALAAGLLMGAGMGMILQADASSGGLDIPPIILEKKFHIPVPCYDVDDGCNSACSSDPRGISGSGSYGIRFYGSHLSHYEPDPLERKTGR